MNIPAKIRMRDPKSGKWDKHKEVVIIGVQMMRGGVLPDSYAFYIDSDGRMDSAPLELVQVTPRTP